MRFEVQTNLHPLGPGDLSNAFIVCSSSKHTVEQAINSALQVHVELVAHPKVTLQALSKVLKSVQCCGSINPGVLHTIPDSNLSSLVDVAFPNQECAHLKLNYESEDVVRMLILGSGSSGHAVQPKDHEKTFNQAKGTTTAVPIGARQSIVQTPLAAGTTTSRLVDDLQGKPSTSSQQQLPKTGNPSTTAAVAGPSSTSVQGAANAARTGVALQPALKAVVASSQRGITAAATEQQIAAAGPRLRRPTGDGGTSTNHVTMHQQGPTAATAVAVLQPSTGNTTPRRATRAAASDVAATTAVELVLPQPKSKKTTNTEMTDIMGQAAPAAVEAAMHQAGDAGSSSVTKDFRVRCGNKEGMLRLPQEQIKSNIVVFCHCSECMKSQSSMSTHRFEEHGGLGKSKSSLKSIKVLPDSTNPGAPKAIMSLKTWLISFKWGTEQAQDPAAVHPSATAAAAGEAVARTREEKAGGSGAVRLYKTADLIKESAGTTKRKRAGGKDKSAEAVAAATGVDVDDDDDEEEEEDVRNLMQTLNNTKPSATDLKLAGNKEFTGVVIHSNYAETSTGTTTDRVFLLDVMCGTKEGQLIMHYPGHPTIMLKIKCMCSDCGRLAMGSTAVGDDAADADNLLMTPRQFEVHGGRGGSKNSGKSIKVVAHPTKPGAPRENMDLKTWLKSFKTFGTQRNKSLNPEAATTQQSADPPAFGDTRLHHPDKAGPSNAPALNALAAGRNSRQDLKKYVSTAAAAAAGSGALLFSSKQGGSASQTAAALIVKKALKMKTGSAAPARLTATAIMQQTASVDTVDKGLNIRQRARPHTASSPKTTKTKEPAAQPKMNMPHNKASAPEVSNPKSAPNDNPEAQVMYKVFKVNCGGHSGQVLYPMEPTKPLLLMCCCLSCGGERPPPTDFLITGAHPSSATTSATASDFMTPGQMEAHCGLGAHRNGLRSIKMVVDASTAGAPKVNMDLRTWLSSLLWKSASPLDPELMYPVAAGSVGTRNIQNDSDTAPQHIAIKSAATVSLKGQTRRRLKEVATGSAAAEEMATEHVAGGSALKAAVGAEVGRVAGEIGTAAAVVVPGSRAKAAAADEKEKRGAAASSRKRTAAPAAMAANEAAPAAMAANEVTPAGKRLVGNQLNDQRDKSASITSRGQGLQKTIKKRRQLSKSQVIVISVISDDSDEGVGYEDEDAHNEGGTSEGRPVTKRVKMVAAEHENVANDEARKQDDKRVAQQVKEKSSVPGRSLVSTVGRKRVRIVGGEGDVVGEAKNSSVHEGMRTAGASASGVGGVLMGASKRKSGAFRRAAAEKAAEGNAAEVLAEFLELKGNIRLTRGSARLAEEEAVESLAALGSTRVGTRSSSGVEGASPGTSR